MKPRLDWSTIVDEGARIVDSYPTSVTLRQLHYRLVAAGIGGYENTIGCYKTLSSRTAELRRDQLFPALADNGRSVSQPAFDDSVVDALFTMANSYRLDRTRGQDFQIWLLFEKATLHAQFWSWTSQYGIPIGALRGYSSETFEREAIDLMSADERPVVVYYVGDLDPEGEDIERNFQDQLYRAGMYFKHWERLAVTPEQIAELGLVPNPGKEGSSRAAGFVRKYGTLFQIETEAVDPDTLRQLVTNAVTDPDYFDISTYRRLLEREDRERTRLMEFARTFRDADDGEML